MSIIISIIFDPNKRYDCAHPPALTQGCRSLGANALACTSHSVSVTTASGAPCPLKSDDEVRWDWTATDLAVWRRTQGRGGECLVFFLLLRVCGIP